VTLLQSLATAAEPVAPDVVDRIDVFTSGVGGYFSYRIPAIVVSPNGTLLVFCEGRKTSRSDDGDIDLLLRRSTDGGKTWLDVQLVYEEGGDATTKIGNPCPVVDAESKTVWLTMNRSGGTERSNRSGGDILVARSTDDGATWSKPADITRDVKKPGWRHYAQGPGVGVQLTLGPHKGRLVVPANYRESFDNRDPSFSHVMFSDDHGQTWRLGGIVGPHTNECQVVEILEQGRPGVLINMRNHWARAGKPELSGKRLVARSFDGGTTWSEAAIDAALIEPICQASLFRYSWGSAGETSRILFANPANNSRDHLTIRVSFDEGRSWPVSQLIDAGSAAYSCLTRLPDGRVGLIYERGDYKHLTFTAVSVAAFEGVRAKGR
jgi:sialidase-1